MPMDFYRTLFAGFDLSGFIMYPELCTFNFAGLCFVEIVDV